MQATNCGKHRFFPRRLSLVGVAMVVAALVTTARAALFDGKTSSTPPVKAAPADDSSPRPTVLLAVPDPAAQRAAVLQLKDVVGGDLSRATSRAAKSKLAAHLLDTASQTTDPAVRYVLLKDAAALADDAADIDTVLAVFDQINQTFQIDAAGSQLVPLEKLIRLRLEAADDTRLSEAAMSGAGAAMASNQYDVARRFANLATTFARRTDDHDLMGRATVLTSQITRIDGEHRRVMSAEAILIRKPDDPIANAAVGRFDCLIKGDWAAGLPMLAKGSNAALRQIASKELASPVDAHAREQIANAWWSLADAQPAAIQPGIRAHAAEWYAKADKGLSGLAKLRAEERITQARPAAGKKLASAEPKTTAPDPSTDPPANVINGALAVIQSVPQEMYPRSLIEWTSAKQREVNQVLSQKLDGQKGTFSLICQGFNIETRMLTSRSTLVGKFSFRLELRFDESSMTQAVNVRPGASCVITGDIEDPRYEGMELVVEMQHCQVLSR